jgi:hypothetical protein
MNDNLTLLVIITLGVIVGIAFFANQACPIA